MPPRSIPIIDLFAGPGGLGEGFASAPVGNGAPRFRIALSIEKEVSAHRTLELRAFYRQFGGRLPESYHQHARGEICREELFGRFPDKAELSRREAWHFALAPETAASVRTRVADALGGADPWVLIGGPPCQAYSLIGRSRNLGKSGYIPERDHRQKLYVEYLQIVADHAPAAFVMENVKGLLSASLNAHGLIDRIADDLRDPALALGREGRSTTGRAPKYWLYSLVSRGDLGGLAPSDFLIRAEKYGVPQARHRVIILGVREDLAARPPDLLSEAAGPSVRAALAGLPRIRSGLTDREDSGAAWLGFLRGSLRRGWFDSLESSHQEALKAAVDALTSPRAGRGGEYIPWSVNRPPELSWVGGGIQGGVINHRSRAHISSDLERYLFASTWAKVHSKSPELGNFPRTLQPEHHSAARAQNGGHFADRFRVQVASRPSTTVTSHISKDGHYYIHPDPTQCRSLTVREAARLQTFPDDYLFCGPRTDQFTQVGNAVPPFLAGQIAEVIRRLLD